jgi:CheY-like chemotaxis protein
MNSSPCRILVADDNSDAADSIAELLRSSGHEVRAVYDGRQAVEASRVFRPHLVILDINMPVMDGYEAAAALRRESTDAELVLIAHTSLARPSDADRFRRAGFDHYLGKPAAPGEISAFIEECLGSTAV